MVLAVTLSEGEPSSVVLFNFTTDTYKITQVLASYQKLCSLTSLLHQKINLCINEQGERLRSLRGPFVFWIK